MTQPREVSFVPGDPSGTEQFNVRWCDKYLRDNSDPQRTDASGCFYLNTCNTTAGEPEWYPHLVPRERLDYTE